MLYKVVGLEEFKETFFTYHRHNCRRGGLTDAALEALYDHYDAEDMIEFDESRDYGEDWTEYTPEQLWDWWFEGKDCPDFLDHETLAAMVRDIERTNRIILETSDGTYVVCHVV